MIKPIVQRLFNPGAATPTTSLALLLLRLWLGLTLLFNHGLAKLTNFSGMSDGFLDLFGIGSKPSLVLAIFGEFFCAALLALGLVGRFAAFCLVLNMAVAFGMAHKLALSGPSSGELAFIYLAGFVTLLVAGPGRISADAFLFGKPAKSAKAG